MKFLVNPGGRKMAKGRTAAQKRATAKMIAANRRKRGGRRSYRRNPPATAKMKANAPARRGGRRRPSYRRNPPILKRLTSCAIGATGILAGEYAMTALAKLWSPSITNPNARLAASAGSGIAIAVASTSLPLGRFGEYAGASAIACFLRGGINRAKAMMAGAGAPATVINGGAGPGVSSYIRGRQGVSSYMRRGNGAMSSYLTSGTYAGQ